MGRRLRVSLHSSPMMRCKVLPWGMHKPWAGSNRYQISELLPFTAAGPPAIHSSSLPLCIRFKMRFQLMMPIRIMQCSILGAWLALTQAGFTPASQSDLASPHVHPLVRRHIEAVREQPLPSVATKSWQGRRRALNSRPRLGYRFSSVPRREFPLPLLPRQFVCRIEFHENYVRLRAAPIG